MPGVELSLQSILCRRRRHQDMSLFFNCTECVCKCCELWRTACFVVMLNVYKVSEELRLLRPVTSSKTLFQNAFGPSIFYLLLVDDTVSPPRSSRVAVFSSLELIQDNKNYYYSYH